MSALRLFARLLLLLPPLAVAACGSGAPGAEEEVDPARLRALGRRDAAHWIAAGRQAGEVSSDAVLPLGYLERLRLGLGSPFRLIDLALHDPRLSEPVRVRTARALLARTLDRQLYQIDPAVLDLVGLAGSEWVAGVGRYHLRLIDDAISESPDPRAGELAVRLAYTLAAAEGSVDAGAPALVAQAAALIRDRELARADARRLLRAAQEAGKDPVALVASWRSERRFEVEQPPLTPLGSEAEREAIEFSLRLARAVQALSPRLAAGAGGARASRPGSASLLGPGAARALAEAATTLGGPPRTPVAVAVEAQRPELRVPWLTPEERSAWRRFLERSRDEEGLVAEYALLLDQVGDAATAAGEAVLGAAVGMRTYAQERIWFPGYGGPTTRELEDRFGLAAVRFDDDVPAAWRPFYRGVLAEALGELQRVLPSLNVRGLTFHLGASRGGAATLALHDPNRRTIFLAPETGMGTRAHEVAHDLDWQVALRRFRVRGDYASDRAVRERGDRLAGSIRRLTSELLRPPIPGDPTPVVHAQRPAEVFARSVDWFVLVSLAREGRSNGYLTSAQDAMLTGYGTVRPPELSGTAGQALVTILDEIAPLYPATRDWFLQSYGPNRALTPYDLVRRIVEAREEVAARAGMVDETGVELALKGAAAELVAGPGIAGVVADRFRTLEEARSAALAAVDAWVCRAPTTVAYDPRLGVARRQLIARATEARARGLSLNYAAAIAGTHGRDWMARQFYGPPWPTTEVEPLLADFLGTLALEVERLGEVRVDRFAGALAWPAFSNRCETAALLALKR
jgi:hypothetical protein